MVVGIIEFRIRPGQEQHYAEIAAKLHAYVASFDGFISVERFESRTNPGKLLSLSYWRDAEALAGWRADADHRVAMKAGRDEVFDDYCIVVAEAVRDYSFKRDA